MTDDLVGRRWQSGDSFELNDDDAATPWHPDKIQKWLDEPMRDKPDYQVIIGGPKLPEQLADFIEATKGD